VAYTKKEFYGPSFLAKELGQRWDRAASHLAYFQHAQPTVTDLHYRRVVRNLLARWLPKPEGLRALKLDLFNEATGTTHMGYFTEKGAKVFGIDVAFKITRQAHLKCGEQIAVVQGDVRDFPFLDNSFDFIFSLGTMEHVQDADQPKVMRELYRVLRPGGRCLLGVNNRHSLWLTPVLFEFLEYSGLIREQWSYEPTYPPSHLKRLFREAGFHEIQGDGTLLFPKWLRVYDMWSSGRKGGFFSWANRLKDVAYRPFTWGFEKLESWGILNYFADQTLTIGVKPDERPKKSP